MSLTQQENTRHSADVRMHLRVNGRTVGIAQLGPDYLIVDNPINHPPSDAEISVSIDGNLQEWPVYLPEGLTPDKLHTRIQRCRSQFNGSTV
jgi:hypothetical protein